MAKALYIAEKPSVAQEFAKALKINGLGTVNVFLRWKLFCKDDIIFRYGNTADSHGIVSIGRYFQTDAEE